MGKCLCMSISSMGEACGRCRVCIAPIYSTEKHSSALPGSWLMWLLSSVTHFQAQNGVQGPYK